MKKSIKLDPSCFDQWFLELSGHEPFPWQRRLFQRWLCPPNPKNSRWPTAINIPTACGKTSIIDISLLALAAGAPCARRRIAFVVDRRVIVDEAAEHAWRVKERLEKALRTRKQDPLKEVAKNLADLGGDQLPLVVVELRGGMVPDNTWARSPLQPTVILSTVDQVGSRILFRSYGGLSPKSWPVQAGLLGTDTLIIVDEAHCSNPFCETVEAIAERWRDFAESPIGTGLSVVCMSATLLEEPDFTLNSHDHKNRELRRRLKACKKTKLMLVNSKPENHREGLVEKLVEQANDFVKSMDSGVVSVVVNRVADARAVFESLELPEKRKLLLTGRVRGWERDRLLQEWLPVLRSGSTKRPTLPVVVVSTQCIEVGADFDFDAMVTEIAPLDSLRQRFGRLNRLGRLPVAEAVVVATSQQEKAKNESAKNPDPIYGHSIFHTWHWLKEHSDSAGGTVDFGILALEKILPKNVDEMKKLCQEKKRAHILLPPHIDMLSHTSPPPAQEPEISAFLHGETTSSPDVTVIWRCDLEVGKENAWASLAAVQPPARGEGCPVPIWEFRKWLAGDLTSEDTGDVEGIATIDTNATKDASADGHRKAIRWLGPDDAQLVEANDVRPGDVVIVPSSYGGCDVYGWNPSSTDFVEDIGDAVAAVYRRPVLRVDAALAALNDKPGAFVTLETLEAIKRAAAGEDDAPPLKDSLKRLANDGNAPDWLRDVARKLNQSRPIKSVETNGTHSLVAAKGRLGEVGTTASETAIGVEVGLYEHSQGVRGYARVFSSNLPKEVRDIIQLAAEMHDLGKADPRFQAWLLGGNILRAHTSRKLLAKSSLLSNDRDARNKARDMSGYPKGGRHEAQSLSLALSAQQLLAKVKDPDLVFHLIASHHGFSRPFMHPYQDQESPTIKIRFKGLSLSSSEGFCPHRIDSGIAERYWRLVRRYGWWGLAYLEAILRLADQRRSEEESEGRAK